MAPLPIVPKHRSYKLCLSKKLTEADAGFEPGPPSKNGPAHEVAHNPDPPTPYTLEDKLNSNVAHDSNHQTPEHSDHVEDEFRSTILRDGYERDKIKDSDTKSRASMLNVKPDIVRGIESMVAAFESWITPKVNKTFYGSASSLQEPQPDGKQNQGRSFIERMEKFGNHSSISDSSVEDTSFNGAKSIGTPDSTSTMLSSVFHRQYDSIRTPAHKTYRPDFPFMKETDEEAMWSSIRNDTLKGFPEQLYSTVDVSDTALTKGAQPPIDEQANQVTKDFIISAASEFREDIPYEPLEDKIDDAMQIQRNRELADQEAAAEAQRSYDQLLRMQREFDEEATRLQADRQMALEYVRGLEEAIRIDGELRAQEAILIEDFELAKRLQSDFQREEAERQQDFQTTANFAKSFEEAEILQNETVAAQTAINADRAFAAKLRDEKEKFLQNDHSFAKQLQADMQRKATNESEDNQLLLSRNLNLRQQNCGDYSERPAPGSMQPSIHIGRLESPPLPFHRFPSLENIKGSARVSRRDHLKTSNTPQPSMNASLDRAAAQVLFEEEQMRYAEANERWKRGISAWQAANEAEVEAVAAKHARLGSTQRQMLPAVHERPAVVAAQSSLERDVADCGICVDSIPKSRLVRPCKHFYCRPCLSGMSHI